MSSPPVPSSPWIDFRLIGKDLGNWARSSPQVFWTGVALLAVVLYFYAWYPAFNGMQSSVFGWAWSAWNPETNYEHAKLIPVIFALLIAYHWKDLRTVQVGTSLWGIFWVVAGGLLFLISIRTLQARVALFSLPFLLYGSVLFVWGKQAARILLFPLAFLFFMIPLQFIEQATVNLQFIITAASNFICNLIGIRIYADGVTLHAADGAFHMEVAGGCSGIRSLMAITMLSALYVHFTQDRLWKKVLIFSASAVFAMIGNMGRVISTVIVAKFIDPEIATGTFHDASGFVFFPVALAAMVAFGKLLNIHPRHWFDGRRRREREERRKALPI